MSHFSITINLNPYVDGENTSFDFTGKTLKGMEWKARARTVRFSGGGDNTVWITGPGYKKGTTQFGLVDRQEIIRLRDLPDWVLNRILKELDQVQISLGEAKSIVTKARDAS